MKILDDIISALDPDTAAKDIRQGLFYTGVLTRNCGLAATLPRDALKQGHSLVDRPGTLLDRSPLELARMAYSESLLEAAIGMATINSLVEIDERSCRELNAGNLIAETGAGKATVVIGHFPFVPRLKGLISELKVIEKNPVGGDYAETETERLVPEADVVAITGTAFTNHTIENLLRLCSPRAYVIVLGGTVPMSDVLFDYGVDAISGTMVTEPEMVLRCVSQGANYRQIKGIRQITMTRE